jgi:hypothetical protein
MVILRQKWGHIKRVNYLVPPPDFRVESVQELIAGQLLCGQHGPAQQSGGGVS